MVCTASRRVGENTRQLNQPGQEVPPDHTILLKEHGCALIEAVGDLGQLRRQRFEVWILPLKMRGLDSSPIRLIAVEEEKDDPEAFT